MNTVVEYQILSISDDQYAFRVITNGEVFNDFGPFDTRAECEAVLDDLMNLMRASGAIDMPKVMQ